MRTYSILLISLNWLSPVWSTERPAVWFGNVFTNVMNNFSINSNVIQNNQCKTQNQIFQTNFQNGTYWAVQMVDASAKSLTGIMEGNGYHLGFSTPCIQSHNPQFNISGKYCLARGKFAPRFKTDPDFNVGRFSVDFPPYNQMLTYWEALRYKTDILWNNRTNIRWGVCIPDACTHEDLWLSLNHSLVAAFEKNNITLDVSVSANDCYTQKEMDDRSLTTGGYVWLGMLAILCVSVLVATTYDWLLRNEILMEKQRLERFEQYALPFSMIASCETLCKIHPKEEFSVMYGMKALFMLMVVLGHSTLVTIGNNLVNLTFLEKIFRDICFSIFTPGALVVDTFLTFGGYLMAHNIIKQQQNGKKFNILVEYLNRILRILPSYIFMITFYMYILPVIGEGPRWKEIILREASRCQKNWWANLLFINNFVEPDNMCLIQSWYLSADIQMFIFSVPIIYYIWSHPKLKVPVLSTLLTLSMIIPSVMIYTKHLWGMYLMRVDWFYDLASVPYFTEYYIQPHARYITYIVGIGGAFWTHHWKQNNFTFKKREKFVLGVLCILTFVCALMLYPSSRFYMQHYQYNLAENIAFALVQRLLWSGILIFIVMVHSIDGTGIIGDIFSLPMFVPLGRLTLTTCLVNFGVAFYSVSTNSLNFYLNGSSFCMLFLGNYVISTILAFVLTILVEAPFEVYSKRFKKYLLEEPDSSAKSKTENEPTYQFEKKVESNLT